MSIILGDIQQAYYTAAQWTAWNGILLAGQKGIESDTLKEKVGDGVTVWNSLTYSSVPAQNLSNVLSVGNTTGGLNLVVTNDDIIQIGTTANRYIGFSTATVTGGLEIVNLNSNDHIILQDSGGIHIDTSKVILEQLTASRILSLNANKEIVNETGTGFLKLTAGVISYDNSSYQPLDSDLTSWAVVTRAAGFDTFVATPSSANLASLVTDETGSGSLVFGTSPTFTTNITTPKIIGTASVTYNAAGGNHVFQSFGATVYTVATNSVTHSPVAATSGATSGFTFNVSANTGQTASTEIPNFRVLGASKTWANGGAATTIALQRWNYFTANTANTSGGGSLTITDSVANYAEVAVAGTASITNNWGFGTNGGIKIFGTANTVLGNAALATNATTGFLHVPSCAGVPTGVPTLYTGMIPVVCDSTNNKMYIYSGGAWVALN